MTKGKSQVPEDATPENEQVSTSVPPAMLKEHASTHAHIRSHAAHLDEGRGAPRTKPAGDLRQGAYRMGRKQP